ncbi:MAG: hypothetical protein U1E23_14375 [Reyranellaceae bacterium]
MPAGVRFVVAVPLLSALALLSGCGGSPSAPAQADQEAKQFPPPAPDKGALYVYRASWLGAARPLDVALVGGATVQLPPNTFIRLEGPPGPVEIDCKVGDQTGGRQVQIAYGQTRYVEVAMTMGAWAPGCAVEEVAADTGQRAVRAARRLEPQ